MAVTISVIPTANTFYTKAIVYGRYVCTLQRLYLCNQSSTGISLATRSSQFPTKGQRTTNSLTVRTVRWRKEPASDTNQGIATSDVLLTNYRATQLGVYATATSIIVYQLLFFRLHDHFMSYRSTGTTTFGPPKKIISRSRIYTTNTIFELGQSH